MWHTPRFPARILLSPRDRGPSGSRRPSHRRAARPRLEALEDRALLSTMFPVTLTSDSPVPQPGELRYEINAAEAAGGGKIIFQLASHSTITLTQGELPITTNLNIKGPGANQLTISGNDASRVFDITSGAGRVTLDGLTITGGAAPMGGGVLIASGAKVTITNSAVTGNTAQGADGQDGRGGGIYVASGATLALDTTSVVDNQAVGGIATMTSDDLGGAGEGGGMFTEAGSASTITGSWFLKNLALGGDGTYGGHGGGAGFNNHGQLTITRTTIADNHSVGGNGLFAGVAIAAGVLNENEAAASGTTGPGAVLTIASSTLEGNVATGGASSQIGGGAFGAGLMNLGGILTATGTTITDNSAVVGPGPLNSPLLGYYLALTAGLGALGQFNTLPLKQVDVLARGFSVAGGLMSLGGTVSLHHTTIAGNHALIGLVANVLILP